MKNLVAILLTCLACACYGDSDTYEPEPSNCDSGDAGREETGTASQLCEGDACNVAAIVDGQCVITPIPGCSFCATAGTKREGQSICCVGCWAGESCRAEPDELACGKGGGLCEPCDGTKQCVNGACSWQCVNNAVDEGETSLDCGGVCPACIDGLPCDIDADCSSGMCVPVFDKYPRGYCFGQNMNGCIQVPALTRGCLFGHRMFVCADSVSIETLGECVYSGADDHGIPYVCCNDIA